MVLAGPGSGKTHVIVQHILFLLQKKKISPSQILVLTFSKAAAQEMKKRFLDTCPQEASPARVCFGTFHSVFLDILKRSEERSGRTFPKILNGKVKQKLFEYILYHFMPEELPDETDDMAEELSAVFSAFKNGKVFPGEKSCYFEACRFYETFLAENNLMDFDDILIRCRKLLKNDPAQCIFWQNRYRYILVDEFQDINALQYEILLLLGGKTRNIFAVGDDDQSIYGFRGSSPLFMQEFLKLSPPPQRILLSANYRCGEKILNVSRELIRENRIRIEKDIFSACGHPGAVFMEEYETDRQQYAEIAAGICSMPAEEQKNSAVLFRTKAQLFSMVRILQKNHIPYRSDIQIRDPFRKEIIQDIYGYFHLAEMTSRHAVKTILKRKEFLQIMNHPQRYISRSFFEKEEYSFQELRELARCISGKTGNTGLLSLLTDLQYVGHLSPFLGMHYLFHTAGYRHHLESIYEGEKLDAAIEYWNELKTESRRYGSASWRRYLENLFCSGASGNLHSFSAASGIKRDENISGDGIRLMTIHSSKGLEFHTVWIPDLNEGILPSRRSVTPEQIEEERRLLYVGMTRAKNTLHLCCIAGSRENPRRISSFLTPSVKSGCNMFPL